MTGAGILKTITAITMVHTVADHLGTGAVIMTHGTGTLGHITALGDSTDGITTAAGITTAGSTEVGMTHGITQEHGVSMTLGTMADGMVDGTHITLVGMVV